jgi:2-polyprenyl-6-methoxyphenol hydroxylase-like FAD-dependent oxidoreductase
MMLGFLLARMGVDVCVLEKHKDFLRDFRGDTIHPSTLELMFELGLLEEFLKRPHQKARELGVQIGNETVTIADFAHLPTRCKFVALMPQWDFLNFIAEQGKCYRSFRLQMQVEASDLLIESGRVVGVKAKTPEGELEVRSTLVVGADGRHSLIRERAGLKVTNLGAPMDVLWMRLSRRPDDLGEALGHVEAGRIFITINREQYWQCAFVVPKGRFEEIKQKGLPAFRDSIARLAPYMKDRVQELRDWSDISLLTVVVDRLDRWSRPGLLCIGDAAHAMSPIGGVGINLAIQDAVACANLLGSKLTKGTIGDSDLELVQRRREFPTRTTQRMQLFLQNKVVYRVLSSGHPVKMPLPFKLLQLFPALRRIPARIIGMGFRPEHIQTPEMVPQTETRM